MSQTIHLTQPKRDVQTVETRSGLPVHKQRPQARFVYVVFPKSWEYHDDHGFIPVMRRLVAKPGANGVDNRGNLNRPIASAIQKGGAYIDPKDTRLGPFMDYVQYYDTENGGRWYVDFCSKATVLASGEIIWNTRESGDEFARFRKHVADAGIVPAMLPEVFEWIIIREEQKAQQLMHRSDSSPHLLAKYDKQCERIDRMRKTWEDMKGTKAKAAGKASSPRRKKADNIIEG
jgi:hypothetical protein